MKYVIASDIHGSAYYCRQLLLQFEKENASRLILLGDILYHGPRNDLPKEYSPKMYLRSSMRTNSKSPVYAATVTAKSIKWFWTSLSWQHTPCFLWAAICSLLRTVMNTIHPTCRRFSPETSCCTAIRMFRHGSLSARSSITSIPALSHYPKTIPRTAT